MLELKDQFPRSICKACKVLGTSKSSLGYKSIKNDTSYITQLEAFSKDHPREGFWKAFYRLRNSGTIVNHKRLHRVYKALNLPLCRKAKKRLP
jgi:putative transposase